MAHYPYLSTARKCGTLREIIRWQTVVAHYPYLSTARKCDTLHKIIHRYTIVAHHLKLNHPKAMLVQWPRLKSVTSQFQVQRVTATPVLWATAVQGTGLLVLYFFLVNSQRMALLLMFSPPASLLACHSHAQNEVHGNIKSVLNSSVHEMNEYYVSRFIFYFTVDITPFLKHIKIIS